VVNELTKPESFRKGEDFENYIRKEIFTDKYYSLVDRSHAYEANQKDFVRSSLNPDFKYFDKKGRKEFWVEVKFRSETYGGRVNWCSDQQLKRYQDCHRKIPTFVILGIGGTADRPGRIFLLSMTQAKYTSLFESLVYKYEILRNQPISSEALWNR